VPSRVHRGEFFALPQSPQIFKQILMIAGMDRYVRSAAASATRPARRPAARVHQIDVEMSFATEDVVYQIVEGAIRAMWQVAGHGVPTPFPRITYDEALLK